MRMHRLIIALSLLSAAGAAQADLARIAAGAGIWGAQPDGTVEYRGDGEFDVEDDLGLDRSTDAYAWLVLEHPVPLLPNLRLDYVSQDFSGSGRTSSTFRVDDTVYVSGTELDGRLELEQLGVVLYYEIIDLGPAQLDLGVDIRYLDAHVRVRDQLTGRSESVSASLPLPLLYAAAQFEVPATDLWLRAQGSGLTVDGDGLLDLRLSVGYDFAFGLGVEAGWRSQRIDLDDVDDLDADLEISGPYAGVHLDF
jgi:outer membrane protein